MTETKKVEDVSSISQSAKIMLILLAKLEKKYRKN